jgi:hypothetical protein
VEPWEEDNCAAIKALYAVYSVPQAAALWCGVPEDQIDEIVGEAKQLADSGTGRGIWFHPAVPCLEHRSRAIAEAIETGSLPHGRENATPVASDEHVAYERRHVMGRELKAWLETALPNEKPAFLFDDIERGTHTSISMGAYTTLKAEHDKLEKRLASTNTEFKKLREAKESIESERDSLRAIADKISIQPLKSDMNSGISQSDYWAKLTQIVSNAVDEYPAWRDSQRKVQKTGNLMEWLTNSVGADNREAEILKKVLSDCFIELR